MKNVFSMSCFLHFIFLFFQQFQESLRIWRVLTSVQIKDGLPGNHRNIFFIRSLFVIGIFQVTFIEFNSISGKINQKLESALHIWTKLVSHGALYTTTVMSILYALVLELPPLTTGSLASEMTKSQSIPQYSFLILDLLSSNCYTPKLRERKSLEDNTHICLPKTHHSGLQTTTSKTCPSWYTQKIGWTKMNICPLSYRVWWQVESWNISLVSIN